MTNLNRRFDLSRRILCALCVLCGSIFSTSRAHAQSRQIPAPPQSQAVIIYDATIHPVSQPVIERGYIIFDAGKITAIGAGDPPAPPSAAPANVVRHSAEGLHVYPGLISSNTYLGLTEVGDIGQTNDHTELGRTTPEVRAASAINPDSDLIPVTRANGILTAIIMPRGGLISGRASAIRMDGWTWEDMAIVPDVGLVINWPRTEPVTAWWMEKSEEDQRKEIREELEAVEKFFDEAIAYLDAKENDPTLATDLRFEGMRAPMRGEKPLFVSASMRGQIESAIAWAARRNLKIIIVGGHQADQCINLIKQHNVPIIINGIHRLPNRRHDPYDQPFALPAKLHEAGVKFCIASADEAAHERNLNYMAGLAAAHGLPKEIALRAVTLSSAEILGLSDQLGSLEVGKSATLIITSGDPLEIASDTLVAFIDGRRVDLGNRQKSLYAKYVEKYRQLGALE